MSVLCSDPAGFSGQKLISKSITNSGNVCCGPMSPDLSPFRIIICYIYIALFCKALYMEGGGGGVISSPSVCSIHLDDIAPESPPHTSVLVERRESDEANRCMGMIKRP